MKTIKIISGAYGHRPYGDHRVVTVKRGEVCEVSDQEAKRLVGLEVAEYVTAEAVATPQAAPDEDAEGTTTPGSGDPSGALEIPEGVELPDTLDIVDGHFTKESLGTLTNAALHELADDLGLDHAKCKNKAELLTLLTAVELDMPGEDDEDAEGDGEDDIDPDSTIVS